MATGLYWCLVLTECLSLVACGKCTPLFIHHCISTASLTQTTPPHSPVCPGDRLVFTCVVTGSGGAVAWKRNNDGLVNVQYGQTIPPFPDFNLNITSYNTTTTELVATATRESATVQLNGSNIGCTTDGVHFMTLTIDIAGKIQ